MKMKKKRAKARKKTKLPIENKFCSLQKKNMKLHNLKVMPSKKISMKAELKVTLFLKPLEYFVVNQAILEETDMAITEIRKDAFDF